MLKTLLVSRRFKSTVSVNGTAVPAVWLRDACQCSSCVHPTTRQKLFSTGGLASDICATAGSDGTISFTSKSDFPSVVPATHEAVFTPEFLAPHFKRFAASLTVSSHSRVHVPLPQTSSPLLKTDLWTAPEFAALRDRKGDVDYHQLVSKDTSSLLSLLTQLQSHGLVFIKNIPTNEANDTSLVPQLEQIVKHMGCIIRETFYGRTWDVKSIKNAKNIAYTSLDLGLHMDLLYFESPPGIQFLHSLKNTVTGGESIFLDSYKAALKLKQDAPHHYKTLTETPITFHYDNDSHLMKQQRLTISEGNLASEAPFGIQTFYSPPFQGPLDCVGSGEQMESVVEALRAFEDVMRDPGMVYRTRLEPGTAVVFRNLRVLHGRTEFDAESGERHFKGAYVDYDVLLPHRHLTMIFSNLIVVFAAAAPIALAADVPPPGSAQRVYVATAPNAADVRPPADGHTGPVSYYGGRLLEFVQIYPIYVGAARDTAKTDAFYKSIVSSSHYDLLAGQYDSSAHDKTIRRGRFVKSFIGSVSGGTDPGAVVKTLLDSGVLGTNISADAYFPVHYGPEYDSSVSKNCTGYCAYHFSINYNGQSVAYALIPDCAATVCASGYPGATPFDSMTCVASHELFESVTDPDQDSWFKGNTDEIADICSYQCGTVTGGDGAIINVQYEWSNYDNGCVILGGPGVTACLQPWDGTLNYPPGAPASVHNTNYRNKWWENPSTVFNADGGWNYTGPCTTTTTISTTSTTTTVPVKSTSTTSTTTTVKLTTTTTTTVRLTTTTTTTIPGKTGTTTTTTTIGFTTTTTTTIPPKSTTTSTTTTIPGTTTTTTVPIATTTASSGGPVVGAPCTPVYKNWCYETKMYICYPSTWIFWYNNC
ncbi:UNVERIFIED_CONTAM: hypothetical protein HDU68_008324 [Siphonaria sp. JEL0065]|nr:hypothetical protein HDU68_008324 [Siphonaria sp. JEL0065]